MVSVMLKLIIFTFDGIRMINVISKFLFCVEGRFFLIIGIFSSILFRIDLYRY